MPDIFLSYSRTDQAIARRFAEGFEREGFSVWWDQTLRSGEAYDKVTEKALEEAKAVVVLWSKASVDSRWVRAEATQADRNGTLVPVMIEPCKRPIMFELTHTAELGKWKGDPGDPAWQAFVADVRQFVHKDPSVAPVARPALVPKRRFSTLQIAIAVAALAIAGAAGWWVLNEASGVPGFGTATTAATTKGAVTLAVVPFANPDGSEASRVLAFGVAESVQHQLANVSDLSVISWNSASGISTQSQDIREIAEMLGVAYVVQGSVQHQGEVLRVTARLVDAATERNFWSLSWDRKQQDVFAIQDDIALRVTRALSVSVSKEGQARMRGQGTHSIEAYLEFLEGQDALSTWRIEEAGPAAAHFDKALQIDPEFSRAMVMLARARLRDGEYSIGPDQRAQVEQSRIEAATLVERALAQDPNLSDAYVERGNLHQFDNPDAAEKDYRKAIELSPSNARAYQQFASLLFDYPARRNEIIPLLERARALDPLDLDLDVTLALFLFYEFGKAEESELLLRRVLERKPDYTPAMGRHAEVLLRLGRIVEAIRTFEAVLEIDPEADTTRRLLVGAYVSLGEFDEARRVAEHPKASPACRMALALGEGRIEEAARLAYAGIRDDIVLGMDQWVAVSSITLEGRRSKDYARASSVLEEWLNIVWVSETEPVLGPNRGLKGDILAYAGMLRQAGDEVRAQALLKEVERSMDEDDALKGGANKWDLLSRARLAIMKGDKASTLTILEQMCATAICLGQVGKDPLFASLHAEPRFKAMNEEATRRREAARRDLHTK